MRKSRDRRADLPVGDRRQLIDATAHLLRRDQKKVLGRGWGRRVDHSTVALVIETVMTIDAVAPNIGAVGFGTKRLPGKCSVSLRVARKIDKNAGEAAGIEIHCDRIPVSGFRDAGAVCQPCKPASPKTSKRASTLSASDADAVNAPPLSKRVRAAIAKRAKIIAGITLSALLNKLPSAVVSALGSHYHRIPIVQRSSEVR